MSAVNQFVGAATPAARERLVLAGLAVLAFVAIVLPHPGQQFIDTVPDMYLTPADYVGDALSAWVDGTGLGSPSYNAGYLPAAVSVWGLNLATPEWLAMRLWRLGLVLLAAAGARALVRDLGAGSVGAVGRIAAAVLYVVNPYVLVGAATTPIMLPYAVYPWLLLAMRRSFREDRWWLGTCGVGFAFFFMGGMNAGVVPLFLLLGLVPVCLDAVLREGVPVRRVLRGLVAGGVASVLVSAYWLVSTASALTSASTVAGASEDPRTVAEVSSYAESLRGLGSWLIYYSDANGPGRPGFSPYVDHVVVIVASFTVALIAFVGAALSRSALRPLGAGLTLLGLVVMVGGHPPESAPPIGRAFLWAIDHVPGLLAFRTTNKAGAIAMLGLALLGALGAEAAVRVVRGRWRPVLLVGVSGALALGVTPVLTGNLLPGALPVPNYWRVASQEMDSADDGGRVLALPGESNARYRWRPFGVDDVATALVDRPLIYSRNFPNGPEGSWRSLAGAVNSLGHPGSHDHTISRLSSYLGVRDVLVRNDMAWEDMGAVRPRDLVALAENDDALSPAALYGAAGTNVRPAKPDLVDQGELALAPLIRYRVDDPTSPARLYAPEGQTLVVGDGSAFAGAAWAGILDGDRLYRRVVDTDSDRTREALTRALEDEARFLLTDTNRRAAYNVHDMRQSGPLLSVNGDPGTYGPSGSVQEQTVAEYDGLADLTATGSGSIFGPTFNGAPYAAVDGDSSTQWIAGDFGAAVGRSITLTYATDRLISRVTVERRPDVDTNRVAYVRVSAGDQQVDASFGVRDDAVAQFDEPVLSDEVTVTVTGLTDRRLNGVGLAEIRVSSDGAPIEVDETVRLPTVLSDLAEDPDLGPAVRQAPVDVLFSRDLTESRGPLHRRFELPSTQTYELRAELPAESAAGFRTCRSVGEIDGIPVLLERADEQTDGDHVQLVGCDPVTLTAGGHNFESGGGVPLERLLLSSRDGTDDPAPATDVEVSYDRSRIVADVPESTTTRWLAAGVAFDPRWTATLDGRSLGAPQELNGFGLGWPVEAGQHGRFVAVFAPQLHYELALAVTIAALLALGLLLLVDRWRPMAATAPGRRMAARRGRQQNQTLSLAGNDAEVPMLRRLLAFTPVAVVFGAILAAGMIGLVVAVTGVLLVVTQRVRPRALLWAACLVVLLIPVVWIIGNSARLGTVSFELVTGNPWPNRVAMTALLLLATGVFLDSRPDDPYDDPTEDHP